MAFFLLIPCYSAETIHNASYYQFQFSTKHHEGGTTYTYIFYNHAGQEVKTEELKENNPADYLDPDKVIKPIAHNSTITKRTFGTNLDQYPCILTFLNKANIPIISFDYNPKNNSIRGITPDGRKICPTIQPKDKITEWASILGLNLSFFDEKSFEEARKMHVPTDSNCLIQ